MWLTGVRRRIQEWWTGRARPVQSLGQAGLFLDLTPDRHWTSRIAHTCVEFYLQHWKWLWAFLVAIAGLILAATKQ